MAQWLKGLTSNTKVVGLNPSRVLEFIVCWLDFGFRIDLHNVLFFI